MPTTRDNATRAIDMATRPGPIAAARAQTLATLAVADALNKISERLDLVIAHLATANVNQRDIIVTLDNVSHEIARS